MRGVLDGSDRDQATDSRPHCFSLLIALIVGIFAAIAALQWWVATISALAVPVVIAVGMVAAIVGYQNFNAQIQDLRTQLRLAQEDGGRRIIFVSGDHPEPTEFVKSVIEGFGFVPVYLGGLVTGGRLQQAGGPLAGRDLVDFGSL